MNYDSKILQWVYNQALNMSQTISTLLGGDPDESLSGRCGRAIKSGRPLWFVPTVAKVIDWLFKVIFNENDHVLNAIERDEKLEKEIWSWIKE